MIPFIVLFVLNGFSLEFFDLTQNKSLYFSGLFMGFISNNNNNIITKDKWEKNDKWRGMLRKV